MKRAIIMVMILFLVSPALMAPTMAEAAGKGGFWSSLRNRVKGITPKKQATVTTAVGGVRGAASEDSGAVYWKGKEVSEVDEAELLSFNEAINMAVQGDETGALKSFEKFLADYPDSSLRLDALEAVSTLRPEGGATVTPDAEPAASEQPAETSEPSQAEEAPKAEEPAPAESTETPAK